MAYRIDLTPNASYTETVSVSQDDVGREIVIDLYKDGTAYTPTTGTTITMQGTKPSGLGYTITGTASGSTVTFLTTLEMTQEAGRFASEIVLTNGMTVIGTANFALYVEKSPHPSNTIDGTGETMQSLTVRMDALEDRVEEIEQGGGGLTDGIKQALLNCFNHVAWVDEHGQDYVDALEDALYPPATLVSITATYTQGGTVYDNQTLDSLRTDLVVRAIYDNGTSEVVTTYTLSGTLETGTSTITAAYGGKTATFDVTVTHAAAQYTITNTLTNCTNSNSATVINELTAYSGTLTADADYIMGTVAITMGGTDVTSTAYNSATGAISIASVTGNIVITATATEPPITVNFTYPITATWSPKSNSGTLSKAIGTRGTEYRIELDVTSISAASAFLNLAVTGSGTASFGNTQAFAGQTGTVTITHTVSYAQEEGATTFTISCAKGSESANQTAVISDIRIYEV